MMDFLNVAFALPTAVWSAALLVVGLYWLLVIAGALDIDIWHIDGSGDIDVDIDVHLDGAQGHEGAVEGISGLAKLLQVLGLRQVPPTVALSFVIFFGWIASFCGMAWGAPLLAGALPAGLTAGLVSLGSLAVGLALGSLAARPLGPVFAERPARRRSELIGRACRLSTLRVDGRFGQAEIDDGGSLLVVQVRCDHENGLQKGDEALLVHFDPAREAFVIEPLHPGGPAPRTSARRATPAQTTR
jgi:hypothetical protein